MRRHFYAGILVIMFIIITAFQYNISYQFRIEPPSKEWSKEVPVSEGRVKNYPKLVRYNDNFIIAHDDGSKVKIVMVDKLGKKLMNRFSKLRMKQ
jgi:hypothetical protein